jgi:plastocyanin
MRIPRALLMPVSLAMAGALSACGGGDDDGGLSSEPVPADPDVEIVADDMAFTPDEVGVPADEPVTIVIDNRDDGVNHNLHIEGAPEPNRTQLEPGVSQQALTVTLPAGEYEFVCDIHPNMTGTMLAG